MTSAARIEFSVWDEVAGFAEWFRRAGTKLLCDYCKRDCSNHYFRHSATDVVECYWCHSRPGGIDRGPPRDPPDDWHCAERWPAAPSEPDL